MHLNRTRTCTPLLMALLPLLVGCATLKTFSISRNVKRVIKESPVLQNQHMGYMIYDPETSETLVSINADKYFTPASNTKLFTLYASLISLGDSVPTFAFANRDNKLIIDPLGDPTFLHPDFESQRAIERIAKIPADTILITWPQTEPSRYGPGWSWDDYSYSYQVERTALPMYGNVLTVTQIDSSTISPSFFTDFVDFQEDPFVYRDRYQNIFHIPVDTVVGDTITYRVPIQNNHELTEVLLAEATGKVILSTSDTYYLPDTIYNGPSMPLLSLMTQRSDNFLAEQLLYLSAKLSRSEGVEGLIEDLAQNEMSFLPDPLIWVDGSGLSRYNMVTPRNQVALLERMYDHNDWGTLAAILPVGGVSGTIRSWYGGNEPYVFAKTGTLRHNHCVSGYVLTKSGKTLIFSFMNNHFTTSTSDVKWAMQRILETLRDRY